MYRPTLHDPQSSLIKLLTHSSIRAEHYRGLILTKLRDAADRGCYPGPMSFFERLNDLGCNWQAHVEKMAAQRSVLGDEALTKQLQHPHAGDAGSSGDEPVLQSPTASIEPEHHIAASQPLQGPYNDALHEQSMDFLFNDDLPDFGAWSAEDIAAWPPWAADLDPASFS